MEEQRRKIQNMIDSLFKHNVIMTKTATYWFMDKQPVQEKKRQSTKQMLANKIHLGMTEVTCRSLGKGGNIKEC